MAAPPCDFHSLHLGPFMVLGLHHGLGLGRKITVSIRKGGRKESTVAKALALHAADPGPLPRIPQNPLEHHPEHC